jgi:hypothetical protein
MVHEIFPDVRITHIKRADSNFWEAVLEVSYNGMDSEHHAKAGTPTEALLLAVAHWHAYEWIRKRNE